MAGSPIIFSGRRAKLLTADAILNSDGSINDNNGIPNLIKNGHAEVNTTGWTVSKNTSAASRPDSGFVTSSTNITWTRNTTNPIDGQADFLYTKDAANRQGEQVYYGFTVSKKHRAKVMQIEVDYLVNSGTFSAGSSSTDSDVIVYIYDVTNSTFIEPSSFKFLSNSSTIADKFIANFQTSATGSSYRILFHQATTSSSAFTVQFKEIKISPCQYVYGTPITDWVSYTPTGGWTGSVTYNGKWRRVGDVLEVSTQVALSGAPTGTTLSLNHPNSFAADTAKLPSDLSRYPLGDAVMLNTGIQTYRGNVFYSNTTSVIVNSFNAASTTVVDGIVNTTTPFTFDNTDLVTVRYSVPITGWSSSTQQSDGYDGRLITAQVFRQTSAQSLSGSSDIKIQWNGETKDTTSSFDNVTNYRFTVPSNGTYIHTGAITVSTGSSAGLLTVNLYKNGSPVRTVGTIPLSTSIGNTLPISVEIDGNANDYFELYANPSGVTVSIQSDAVVYGGSQWNISKKQAPTTISATATEVATYYLTSNLTINTSVTDITGLTKIVDDFGSMNPTTGVYSFSNPGKFKVSFNSRVDTGGSAASQHIINFLHNASTYVMTAASDLAASKAYNYYPSLIINAVSGDTFKVQIQSLTNSSTAIGGQNFIMIERIK